MEFLTNRYGTVKFEPRKMPKLFKNIRIDLLAKAAWYKGDIGWKSVLRASLHDGTFCNILIRTAIWLWKWKVYPLGYLIYELNAILSGARVGLRAKIAPGLVLLHTQGTVIHASAVLGENTVLENGVTIGAEAGKVPRLGKMVFVGAGARIIGGVTLGDRVKVGANAVVIKDVPDYATAVGVPARIIPHATSDE